MDNIKKALLQLTHNAEIEISKLKLPFENWFANKSV